MRLPRLLSIFSLLAFSSSIAQQPETATSAANTRFKTGSGHQFWMGSNYRKEWKTPVTVPVLNLSTEKGGLTPTKRGGGKQTRSLRVVDPTGREYAIRSIQKFVTTKTLPMDLQSEAAVDLVADGISASYPYAALSIPIMAEAAGVPYLKAKLVYIPDDPKLGEFRADFGNLLAYFEERLPENVPKGWDTEEVVEKLKEDNDDEIDQRALLRARLLDMFVMDFDRHEDQWEWGAIDKDKGKKYYPIPKDRDQAFFVNKGVLPGIIKWPWLVPQLEGIKPEANNIKRFNFAARNLDRFFLNELPEQTWREEAERLVSKMTDDVIDRAMAQQPPEIRSISGPRIASILKERRKHLVDEAIEYYKFLAEDVNITASDKTELFDITRNDDGSVHLVVYKITKEGEQSRKMFDRVFDAQDTKELRLYGFGGNDRFVIKGNNDKIKIRMIGGEGEDSFDGNGAIVYDRKDENNKLTGHLKDRQKNDTIVNSYDRLGYKYNQVIPFVSVGFNQDDGLFLGASLKVIHHGFRKDPYKNSHSFAINHALATKAFNVRYNGEFIGTFGRNSDLLLEADVKAPHITNFFGYGPNSEYDKTKPGQFRYYRARYNLSDFSVLLRKNFSKRVIMTLGPTLQFFKLDPDDKNNKVRHITDIVNNGLDPATLYEKQAYFGGKFSFMADSRDNPVIPRKGVLFNASVRHLASMNDIDYNVTQINSDFTFHLSLIPNWIVLANRTGVGHNAGDFEFYQAQYLGSEDNLRGYRKNRFAGRSKVFNNTDLRIRLINFKTYLFPGSIGILGFVDAGRIWDDTDDDDKWLTGFGGGIWISPLRRIVLTISYAVSDEDKLPLIGLGWKF